MAMPWASGLEASCDRAASADRAKSAHAAARAKIRYGKQEVGLIRLRSKKAAAEHSQSELDGGQLKRLARPVNLLVGLRGSVTGHREPWKLVKYDQTSEIFIPARFLAPFVIFP